VTSTKELEEILEAYVSGNQEIDDFYQGQVKRNKEMLGVFAANEELQEAIEKWIQRRKFSNILHLWVNGLVFDWNKLYGEIKPKRISLPTYPFARERYWISETQRKRIIATAGASDSVIHPLLHENTSDFSEQRFTSIFTGSEFFLNDHKIRGKKVFPGVGYLEMARAAVENALGEIDQGTTVHLKNVVWAQPIVINGFDQKVHFGLFREDDGKIKYEVYTESDNNDEELIVHFQGVAEIKSKEEIPPLDIHNLMLQMNQGTLNAEDCYQCFKEMGIDYGEGHRGIREIYQGENQLLARLSLPSSVQDTQSEYVLHPSLMDATVQSSIGLLLKQSILSDSSETPLGMNKWPSSIGRWTLRPSLPFALESLEILGSCTYEMYAWVRPSDGRASSEEIQKLDIDLCDEQGKVCVKMREVALLRMETTSQLFEIRFKDKKKVELSSLATDLEISSSKDKPNTLKLKSLSGLEANPIDSSLENNRSQVGLSLQTSPSLTTSFSNKEMQKSDPSPQPLISKETVQEELKTSLAKALYMKESDVDIEKPFIEMGLDSIVGVEWIKAINQEYKTNITATKVYDYPNIRELSNYLQKQLKELILKDQSNKELKGVALDTNQYSLSNSPNQLIKNLENRVYASSLRSIR
ncbi:MAG: hypothetical protein GY941_25950, partial [Planctomycetes bacterium]|nr:hypothetical protein [Planctomycetota bacterium]